MATTVHQVTLPDISTKEPLLTTGTPEPEDAEEGRGRKMDPELRSISAILRLLEELDEQARERVVAYITHRYVSAK